MSPGCSAGERRGPVPVPLSKDAAVVGTGKRGEIIRGAPNGVAGDLSGVPKLGMAGDSSRCVSAAAEAANLLHSSSQAKIKFERLKRTAVASRRSIRRIPVFRFLILEVVHLNYNKQRERVCTLLRI